jgi:hypothetical protein
MKIPLLKGSDGQESVSFTMLIISFAVITLWLIVSVIEGVGNVVIRPFDASTAMAYFTPMAMLYFSRKTWTQNAAAVVHRGGLKSDIDNIMHTEVNPSLPPPAEEEHSEETPTNRPPKR